MEEKRKRKIPIIMWIIITFVIAGALVFWGMDGRVLSTTEIEESLIDKDFSYGGFEYNIKREMIKSLNIVKRDSKRKDSDKLQADLRLELDGSIVIFDTGINFKYLSDNWEFDKLNINQVKEVIPKENTKGSVRKLFYGKSIKVQKNTIELNEENLVEISNFEVTGTGTDVTFKGNLQITNTIIRMDIPISGRLVFNNDILNWEIKDLVVNEKEITGQVEKKADIKLVIDYFFGNQEEIVLDNGIKIRNENVAEIHVESIKIIDGKSLESELFIIGRNGDLTRIEFTGLVKRDLELNIENNKKSYNSKFTISKIETSNLDLVALQQLMIGKQVGDIVINEDIANSFLESNRKTEELKSYINGKIQVEDKSIDIQVQLELKENKKELLWSINRICTPDNKNYKNFK